MSRPQNATVAAPESRVGAGTGSRSNPGATGAQGGVGRLKGTCRECRGDMQLIGGAWIHDGLGYWVHLIKAYGQVGKATKDDFALVGPSKGDGS